MSFLIPAIPASFFAGLSQVGAVVSAAAPYALGALSLVGASSSAQAQQEAGRAEQDAYNVNAALAKQKGEQEEEISRDRLRRLMATQRTLYAKAGVDLSSGSPLSLLVATKAEGEKEALNIRIGAQKEAAVDEWSGVLANKTAQTKSRSTLLTGLAQTASTFYAASPR